MTSVSIFDNIEKFQEKYKLSFECFFKKIWKMEHLLQKSKCSIFNNIFKYMIFQRRQKALVLEFLMRGYLHWQLLEPVLKLMLFHSYRLVCHSLLLQRYLLSPWPAVLDIPSRLKDKMPHIPEVQEYRYSKCSKIFNTLLMRGS